jgi:hypothetical protein
MAAQSSGIGRPKFSRVIASGSGPPPLAGFEVSIAVSSSVVRSKSKTSRFSVVWSIWGSPSGCGVVQVGGDPRPRR